VLDNPARRREIEPPRGLGRTRCLTWPRRPSQMPEVRWQKSELRTRRRPTADAADVMTAGTDIHRFRRLRRFLSRQRTPRTPRGMSFRVSPPHCPTGDVEANEESSRPAADGADGPGSDTRAPGPLHCRTGAAAANPCSHSLWCRCRLLRTYHRENGLGGGRRSGRGPMRSISSNPSPIAAPSFRPRNV
jgi:hypothetical protein